MFPEILLPSPGINFSSVQNLMELNDTAKSTSKKFDKYEREKEEKKKKNEIHPKESHQL